MRAKPGFYTPPFSNIFQIYFWSSLYAEKIALWQGPFSKKVEKFLARQKCPHYMLQKWHFVRGFGGFFRSKNVPLLYAGKTAF
jgi:hypothetical protein